MLCVVVNAATENRCSRCMMTLAATRLF